VRWLRRNGRTVEAPETRAKRSPSWRRRAWSTDGIALIFALAAFALTIYQTQVRRIGLADNTDFDRLLNHLGLRVANHAHFPQAYASFEYIRGGTPDAGSYWTSLIPVLDAYTHLATWLGGGRFDLRWLGWAYSVGFAVTVYLLCSAFERRSTQIVFGAVAVTAICDANLVAYFNSFYDEPWSLLLLLAGLAAVLHLRGRRRLPGSAVIGLTVLAVLLLTSKSQNALLGLLFAAGLVCLRSGPLRVGKWRSRLLPFTCAGVVLASIPLYVGSQASVYGQQNLYDGVFQ
jgi:hypothetical protein